MINIIKFYLIKIQGIFKKSEDAFLEKYFDSNQFKTIVQIGANDGKQNDPLQKHLAKEGNYKAVLVEPISYYANKLKKLYKDRRDIEIKEVACGSDYDNKQLFYIPPEIADKMNGNGPFNNWAHGLGSFSKKNVINWIEKNRFRGNKYIDQIQNFKDSIISKKVKVCKTSDVIKDSPNSLIIIDVQGHELEVLKGINFELKRPRYIIIEVDHPTNIPAYNFLKNLGYKWIAGTTNIVFEK